MSMWLPQSAGLGASASLQVYVNGVCMNIMIVTLVPFFMESDALWHDQ